MIDRIMLYPNDRVYKDKKYGVVDGRSYDYGSGQVFVVWDDFTVTVEQESDLKCK